MKITCLEDICEIANGMVLISCGLTLCFSGEVCPDGIQVGCTACPGCPLPPRERCFLAR